MRSSSSSLWSPRKFSYEYGELDSSIEPFGTISNAPSHPKNQDCKDSSISPICTVFGYDRLAVRCSRDFEGAGILLPSENVCACLMKYRSMFEPRKHTVHGY